MVSVIVYTRLKPHSKLLITLRYISCWISGQVAALSWSVVLSLYLHILLLKYPYKNMLEVERSGDVALATECHHEVRLNALETWVLALP